MTSPQRPGSGRLQVGFGLISFSVVIAVLAMMIAVIYVDDVPLRLVVLAFGALLIGVLWVTAIRNGAEEREARKRLREEHPGSLVERVRLWSLPSGRVDKDLPVHFIIADAGDIVFETVTRTALLRIPVEEIGFIDPVTAQGDRTRDKALTIIYGDEENVVQLFTITYAGTAALGSRIRKAIGWPARGIPNR
jgi:hypothetical protein